MRKQTRDGITDISNEVLCRGRTILARHKLVKLVLQAAKRSKFEMMQDSLLLPALNRPAHALGTVNTVASEACDGACNLGSWQRDPWRL